jgi:outer membrane immunogenic protein
LTFNNDVTGGDDSDVGFTGGGQVGFNYQFTPGSGFVVGLEADIQYIGLGGDHDDDRFDDGFGVGSATFTGTPGLAFAPPAATVVRDRREQGIDLDYFGTVRGRVGFAFDRTLIYATGGFAYGGGGDDRNGFDFEDGLSDDEDDFKFGYAVGGGVEFALSSFQLFGSSTATFKIEGLYVNLDEEKNNGGARAVYNVATNTLRVNESQVKRETEFAVVRAGLNFKF